MRRVIEAALAVERVPLPEVKAPSSPVGYVVWAATERPEVVDVLGPILSTARFPVYCGVSKTSGRARFRRYIQSLEGVEALDLRDLYVGVLPCTTPAWAAFTEVALIDGLGNPLLNRLGGFGAKVPGANRRRQRSNALDALWPSRRRWTTAPTPIDRMCARLAVVSYLAELDPDGPRWPAIEPTTTPRRARGGGS
jgi:hypothetical protein